MSYAYNLCQATNEWILTKLDVRISCHGVVSQIRDKGELTLIFEDKSAFDVKYEYDGADTNVYRTEYNKLHVQEKDFVDVMCEDINHILTNATLAEDLSFSLLYADTNRDNVEAADRVHEQIKSLWQKQQKGVPVYTLFLKIDNISKLRDVLQCFDPTTLTELNINMDTNKHKPEIIEFGDIVEMDQWKNAKEINLRNFFVSIPFEHFSHCESAYVEVWKISADDIHKLIEVDFNAPEFRRIIVHYKSLDVTKKLLKTLFGGTYDNRRVRSINNNREFRQCTLANQFYIAHPDYGFSDQRNSRKEAIAAGRQLSKLSTSQGPTEWLHICVIMGKVTQYLDYKHLQVLRKVSRAIRQCIDILKPDPKVVAVTIYYGLGTRSVEIFGKDDSKLFGYSGSNKSDQTNKLDISNFSNDMLLILKNQKTALTELELEYVDEFEKESEHLYIECFEEFVLPLDRLFSVEKFTVNLRNPEIVGQLLTYMDPVSLRKIEFGSEYVNRPWKQIELDNKINLCNMEHWKNAKELTINNTVVKCDVEVLIHFSEVDIILDSMLLQNVVYLKDTFLSSPTFCQFKAQFVNSDINETIFVDTFLGDPSRRVSDPSSGLPNIWFFSYADVDEDLQIRYYQERKQFMFTRIPRETRFQHFFHRFL
ncbi:FTH domain-containing protein [Caenorhabditis elegans]|uniref:FTH domain-containing protein n=1 Tax=Caenorhabditis elegans TaxID=6239 RepID=Q6HAE7_CAEEL|nr:FTH domain-containing protein [Caenorhabditis elegans]CCD70284.2 FTH domain-containing protein [Caenorhabditis elegans]